MPQNFLNRYNKFAGVIQLSEQKYLLYTSYTFCVLDLAAQVPEVVETVPNHPTKTQEGQQMGAQTWHDNLKLSQAKYLDPAAGHQTVATQNNSMQQRSAMRGNLAIDNRFKGILLMDIDNSKQKSLRIFEHSWKQAISNFQSGAFVHKKFRQ